MSQKIYHVVPDGKGGEYITANRKEDLDWIGERFDKVRQAAIRDCIRALGELLEGDK